MTLLEKIRSWIGVLDTFYRDRDAFYQTQTQAYNALALAKIQAYHAQIKAYHAKVQQFAQQTEPSTKVNTLELAEWIKEIQETGAYICFCTGNQWIPDTPMISVTAKIEDNMLVFTTPIQLTFTKDVWIDEVGFFRYPLDPEPWFTCRIEVSTRNIAKGQEFRVDHLTLSLDQTPQ